VESLEWKSLDISMILAIGVGRSLHIFTTLVGSQQHKWFIPFCIHVRLSIVWIFITCTWYL